MRLRPILLLLALVLLAAPFTVSAQSNASVVWNRWDAQIATQSNSDQLQIAETQEINIQNGTIRQGTRYWTSQVQVQAVYVILNNDSSPVQLQQSSNGQPGTYNFSQASARSGRCGVPGLINSAQRSAAARPKTMMSSSELHPNRLAP